MKKKSTVKKTASKEKPRKEQPIEITIKKSTGIAVLIILSLVSVGVWAYIHGFSNATDNEPDTESATTIKASIIQSVSAEEIGSMFVCPCCGNPITKRCCGMARERMAYLEAQVDAGLSKEQVVMNMVKKHGLTSMMEEEREKFKLELEKNAPPERPKIVITPTRYDFGDVSVAKGVVTTLMKVKNEGSKNLIINKIETSCGCTSASLIVGGVEGPKFSMPGHGKQPAGWSATIPPGGEAQLKVYYDPRVHKTMRGPGTRTIDVSSNDPVEITKQVRVEFNQVA